MWTDLIEALKGQPLVLALVAMNIGLLYYAAIAAPAERKLELELLYRNRTEVGKLLAECYPAPPGR